MSSDAAAPADPALWRIAVVAAFGPLLAALDASTVNIALLSIGEEFGASLGLLQWVVTGYLLALVLALPLSGWLVDRWGAKRMYIVCFVGFCGAAIVCSLARSATELIVFRFVQGLAGGLLTPMAQMMVARAAGPRMASVMSWMGIPIALGTIVAPAAAGLVLAHFSWRYVLLLSTPLSILAIIAAIVILKNDAVGQRRRLDVLGFIILSPALMLVVGGAAAISSASAPLWVALPLCLAGLLLLWGFVAHARRSPKRPLLEPKLFGYRSFLAASLTQSLSTAATQGGQFLLPVFLMLVIGLSPAMAGLHLAAVGAGFLAAMPLVAILNDRLGPRRAAVLGAGVILAGTIVLLAGDGLPGYAVVAALASRGFGAGVLNLSSMSSAYVGIPLAEVPDAATTLNVVQRLGGPLGVVGLALMVQHQPGHGVAGGGVIWAMLGLCILSVGAVFAALQLPARGRGR